MLTQLIESTNSVLTGQEKQNFLSKIRSSGIRIEERIEVLIQKLEASSVLLPTGGNTRDDVKNRLIATFHSVRDLGGRAAHLSSKLSVEEVHDHFTLFASSIYPIAVKIIEFQATNKQGFTEGAKELRKFVIYCPLPEKNVKESFSNPANHYSVAA